MPKTFAPCRCIGANSSLFTTEQLNYLTLDLCLLLFSYDDNGFQIINKHVHYYIIHLKLHPDASLKQRFMLTRYVEDESVKQQGSRCKNRLCSKFGDTKLNSNCYNFYWLHSIPAALNPVSQVGEERQSNLLILFKAWEHFNAPECHLELYHPWPPQSQGRPEGGAGVQRWGEVQCFINGGKSNFLSIDFKWW